MPVGVSRDHLELSSSMRAWAAGLGGPAAVREAEADAAAAFAKTWQSVVEMGLTSIGIGEQHGGGGGDLLDQMVALEAAAHAMVPGPAARDDARRAGRDRMATCSTSIAAWCRRGGGVDATTSRSRRRRRPLAARSVRRRLVGADRLRRLERRAGAGRRPVAAWRTRTPSRRQPTVARLDVDGDAVRRVLVALAAAEAAGLAQWCLDTAVDTPRCASSSARRSARSRRSSTCAPRCWRPRSRSPPQHGTSARPWTVGGRRLRHRRRRHRGPRRRRVRRAGLHPGARRHRLHLRARRAPLPPPGGRAARRGGRADRWCRAIGGPPGPPRRQRSAPGASRSTSTVPTRSSAHRPAQSWTRIAALPADEQRAALAQRRLPDAAPAEAVRPGRRSGGAAGRRRGAGPRRARPTRHRDRRLGRADDHQARHGRAAANGSSCRRCSATSSGASCSASLVRAPTWPHSAPAPSAPTAAGC